MSKQTIKVKSLEYHRNGVGGEGFYVAIFNDPEQGEMMGVIFPLDKEDDFKFYNVRTHKMGGKVGDVKGESYNGRIAVFKMDLLDKRNIAFGQNSWRGDHYEAELRRAIGNSE